MLLPAAMQAACFAAMPMSNHHAHYGLEIQSLTSTNFPGGTHSMLTETISASCVGSGL